MGNQPSKPAEKAADKVDEKTDGKVPDNTRPATEDTPVTGTPTQPTETGPVVATDPDRDRNEPIEDVVFVRGESGVIWPHALPLPEVLLDALASGKAQRVNEDGTPWVAKVVTMKPVVAEARPGPGREPLSVEERNAARARGIDVDGPHNVVEVRAELALAGDVTRSVR